MTVDESLLVKMFGFPATLIHGDTAVLDRWLWLRQHLPETCNGEKLVDIGCGLARLRLVRRCAATRLLGLSWSARYQEVAGYALGCATSTFGTLRCSRHVLGIVPFGKDCLWHVHLPSLPRTFRVISDGLANDIILRYRARLLYGSPDSAARSFSDPRPTITRSDQASDKYRVPFYRPCRGKRPT